MVVLEQRDVVPPSCVFPRKVNATICELHAADLVMRAGQSIEVRPHEHDLARVDGMASVDVDDEKPIKLQYQKK